MMKTTTSTGNEPRTRSGVIDALAAMPRRLAMICAWLALALLFGATQAHAALQLDASVNPQPARPGEMLDVEFTITNTDAVQRTGVVLTVVYPTNLTALLSGGEFLGTCPPSFCDPGETVTFSIGTIAAGRSVTVDMAPFVSATAPNGTVITFNPHVADSSGGSDDASVSTTVITDTHYDIALRDSADPVVSGANVTYKITFGYREEALVLADNTLRFPIPAGTSFVSATGGGIPVGGAVEWDLGFMTPGDGGSREVTVHVNAPDNTVLQSSAQVFNSTAPTDLATANALTVVDANAPLSVDVDINSDPARPSELLNVQVVVTNHDAITRLNLTLRVRYPDGLSSTATSQINGASCSPSFCDIGNAVVFSIPSLGAGQSVTFELPPFVLSTTSDGTLVNFFAMLTDTAGGNASGIDSVRVRTLPNYDLSIGDNADPVEPGALLTYKLTYGHRNEAPTIADSILRFRLPAGTSLVSASDGGTFANGAVTWDAGVLNPGDSGTREAVVQVNAANVSVLQASAEIFDAADPIEQAGAEALTVVHTTPPITVDLDANPDPAHPSELLNLLAIVTNHDVVARAVTLRVRYPDGMTSILTSEVFGISCPPSFCDPQDIITWNLGSIAPGASTIVEFPAIVLATAVNGQLLNFYGTLNDTVGGNASAFASVRVKSNVRYDLAVRESAEPIEPGALLTYKLSYGYRQDAPVIANATLRMRLAPGTSFISATGDGVLVGDNVDWNLGTLNPGDGGFRELTVQVDADDASVLQAAAQIFDTDNPVQQAAWQAHTAVDSTTPIGVQIDVNADPARPNEMLNAQFIVSNRDSVARIVTLRGRYPETTTSTATSNAGWNTPASCSPSFCDATNLVTWSVGSIAAGQSVTVELPPFVLSTATSGQLINLFAIATDTTGGVAVASDSTRVSADTRYDLAVRDSSDAVQPGADLTYKITFGYRADAPVIADSAIRFRLPAGTSFMSATQGGFLNGDFVQWNLGTLNPGEGGIRTVTVQVDAPDGAVLQAQAEIYSTASPVEQAQAEALTTVDANPPLSLDVRATSNPSLPNQPVSVTLSVRNLDAITRTVTLRMRYPDGLFSQAPSTFVPAGSCPPSFCDQGEIVTWTLGNIPSGGLIQVTVPVTALSTAVNGQLINFFAIATDTAGGITTGIDSARLGLCADNDSDCDVIPDGGDNCIFADNTSQRDTDEDGIGNICDPDLTQDCVVNFLDLGIFKSRFLTNDPDADFDGSGQVNLGDLGIMKPFFFRAPGPSGVPDNICAP
jgi:hypothetical protein